MRRLFRSKVIVVAALVGITSPANSHHSGSMYEYGKSISLNGVVTRVRWVNPHVYFEIRPDNESEDDKPWVVEAEPPAIMSRFGWNSDSIVVGDSVTINAMPPVDPTRKMAFGVSAVIANGTHLWISGATPYDELARDTASQFQAESLSGTWATQFNPQAFVAYIHREPSPSLTDEGNKALENLDDELLPGTECIPEPVPYPLLAPISTSIEIAESITRIRFEGDQGLVERIVHMDSHSHDGASYSNQGHSIGSWVDGALVVDTNHFEPHIEGHAGGLPSSADKHLVEKFKLNPDGTKLIYTFRVEDPKYLAEPATATIGLTYRPDLEVMDIPCDIESARKYLEK